MKLYITYTPSDLAEHAKVACELARELDWKVVNAPQIVNLVERRKELQDADALLLLAAWSYGGDGRVSPEEEDWDVARQGGILTAALLANEDAPWPRKMMDRGQKAEALENLRSKVRQSQASLAYFDLDPPSVSQVLPTVLAAVRIAVTKRREKSVFVVWDTSVQGLDLILAAFKKHPPDEFLVHVPGLPGDGTAGEILRDRVLPGIRNSDRVLVVTDRPNANVGFEAGLAIGFGKPTCLVFFSAGVPEWLSTSVFKGFVVSSVQDMDELREVVRNENNWYLPLLAEPLPTHGQTLFLAPSRYVGSALRIEQKSRVPHWQTLANSEFNLTDLPGQFPNIAQVVWCIASFSQGRDERDGAENAANALICGWFYARALQVHADSIDKRIFFVRQEDAREVVDVKVKEKTFRKVEEFSNIAEQIAQHDYRLPKPHFGEVSQSPHVAYKMVQIPLPVHAAHRRISVGMYPVTISQYVQFCQVTGHPLPQSLTAANTLSDLPIVDVSYEDALTFCKWLGLSLPDQALWEHFAQAASRARYWWGDDETLLEKVAWTSENSDRRLREVGQKLANTWGLHDVYGNVWEWTQCYEEEAPPGLLDAHVWKAKVCGGAFDTPRSQLLLPIAHATTARLPNVGFRCVSLTR